MSETIVELETQLQCYLHLPRRSGCIRSSDSRVKQSKRSKIAYLISQAVRIGKIRMIQNVETLGPQLRSEFLCNPDLLAKRQVKIHKIRAVELVATNAASSTERRILKSTGVAKEYFVTPINSWIIVVTRGKWVPHLIGP